MKLTQLTHITFAVLFLGIAAQTIAWPFSKQAQKITISQDSIDLLRQDFQLLISKCPTTEEIKTAQEIIEAVRRDTAKMHIANAWHAELRKVTQAPALALKDHNEAVQKSIMNIVDAAKRHISLVHNQLKAQEMATELRAKYSSPQQALDSIFATIDSLETKVKQHDQAHITLLKQTELAERELSEKNKTIKELQQELAQARTSFTTITQELLAELQQAKSLQHTTQERLVKTEQNLKVTEQSMRINEQALKAMEQSKNNGFRELQEQIKALRSDMVVIQEDLSTQKTRLEEKEFANAETPILQALRMPDRRV